MVSFALDFVLWLIGLRGPMPRFDGFRPVPAAPAAGTVSLLRVLTITALVFATLSFALWSMVWLAIQLL